MPYTTYRSLPIEALYDVLSRSVIDLLEIVESRHPNEAAKRELKNQIYILIQLISEKKQSLKSN